MKYKVEIWVWARLVKRADLSISTSLRSSHMPQCLRNSRGRHTLVHFTAQIYLCACTRPDVTLAAAWNNLKHHLGDWCNYIWHSWYTPTGLYHLECCWYAPGNHQPPCWFDVVMMVTQISCYCHKIKNVRGRSGGRRPVSSFGISGFAFWRR